MSLSVTALYAGLLGLWILYLAFRVISLRNAKQVSIGDADDTTLARAVRGHGNATETIPIGLILLALTEATGAPVWVVHGLGLMLLAGRVVHGIHFLSDTAALSTRVIGMLLTISMIALSSIGLVGHAVLGG